MRRFAINPGLTFYWETAQKSKQQIQKRVRAKNTKCFDNMAIYTVKVPAKEHKRPDMIKAKEKEDENLEKYGVSEEVEDIGQEGVASR